MGVWAGLFRFGFQVGRAFLNIAVASVQTAKREPGKLAREFVLDPNGLPEVGGRSCSG